MENVMKDSIDKFTSEGAAAKRQEDGESVPAPSFLYLGDDGNGGVINVPEPDNYDEGSGTLAKKRVAGDESRILI